MFILICVCVYENTQLCFLKVERLLQLCLMIIAVMIICSDSASREEFSSSRLHLAGDECFAWGREENS